MSRLTGGGRLDRLTLPIRKLRVVWLYYRSDLREIARYLWNSTETANFTYPLTPVNRSHLVGFVSTVGGVSLEEADRYVAEIETDEALYGDLTTDGRRYDDVPYGRRMGWYALVRALNPSTIVETGTADGLGTCVLARALQRNSSVSSTGEVYSIDVNENSGDLVSEPYSKNSTLMSGNSVEVLEAFDEPIDMFVHDSKHTEEHLEAELAAIQENISTRTVLISDMAHHSDTLYRFARETNRRFLFFKEVPQNHWYPGAGIGVAYCD